MPPSNTEIPIQTLPLFPILDKALINLLNSLTDAEWQLPTIAKLWIVKDIASHLLDGNLRTISILRDGYSGEPPTNINSYKDLVDYLNGLNISWTNATKRLSPKLLIELLETTGKEYIQQLQNLAPFDNAVFGVSWAGETTSANWFHIAREYTEKFIHQQQIREAVGKQGILTKELFYPFIDTFMYGLPYTYRNTIAKIGAVVQVKITTEIGGEWNIEQTANGWKLRKIITEMPAAIIILSPQTAWQLFSKGISLATALQQIEISGDKDLGAVALQMVSVMA